MTVKNELPALEDLLSAEELEETKTKVKDLTREAYQPVLNSLLERFHPTGKAELTADVTLALVEEAGKPVITNNVSLGIVFTPEKTYDSFEEANRIIIREMFARLIKR